jgi:hypothetical protein
MNGFNNSNIQSINIISIMSRNYRLSVSRNSKGYSFTEQTRTPDSPPTSRFESFESKFDAIKAIDYDKMSRGTIVNGGNEYGFFMENNMIIQQEDNLHKLFFYDIAKEMAWQQIVRMNPEAGSMESTIKSIGSMEIDTRFETVLFMDVQYEGESFGRNVGVLFKNARQYLEVDMIMELAKDPEKGELFNLHLSLHSEANGEANFIFDLPFLARRLYESETGSWSDSYTTTLSLFENENWNGNFMNFVK